MKKYRGFLVLVFIWASIVSSVTLAQLRDGRAGGAIGWIIKNGEDMITPNDEGCWVTAEQQGKWMEWV